jgi:HPt (histidine-containing phosphotransfer) domain-containing protein
VDDLIARFLPQFIESAHQRVRKSTEFLSARDTGKLAAEMHTLAGEASVLGLAEIATLARSAEQLARRATLDDYEAKLAEIEQRIAALNP